jgi:hypothetical protein
VTHRARASRERRNRWWMRVIGRIRRIRRIRRIGLIAAIVYGKNVKVRLLSGLALGSRLTAAA